MIAIKITEDHVLKVTYGPEKCSGVTASTLGTLFSPGTIGIAIGTTSLPNLTVEVVGSDVGVAVGGTLEVSTMIVVGSTTVTLAAAVHNHPMLCTETHNTVTEVGTMDTVEVTEEVRRRRKSGVRF